MVTFNKIIIYLSFVLFIISGVLIRTTIYASLTTPFIVLPGIIIVFIIIFLRKNDFHFYYTAQDNLYYLFLFSCLLSSFVNSDVQNLATTIKFAMFYFVLVICQRNYAKIITFKMFLASYLSGAIIIIILDFLNNPNYLSAPRYYGILGNPNSLGIFSATLFIVSVGISVSSFFGGRLKDSVALLSVSFFAFNLVTMSSSRTSFIGSISVLIIAMIAFGVALAKKNVITKKRFYRMLFVIIVIVPILYYILNGFFYDAIQGNIIAKFERRAGNVTSSRDAIWITVLKNSTLFGHEHGYIDTLSNGLSAHNTFLYQIGQFGWLAGGLYLLFWVVSLFKSLKYFINYYDKDKYSLIGLLTISLFMIISTMEVLSHTTLMYLALFSSGYLLTKNKTIRDESKQDSIEYDVKM